MKLLLAHDHDKAMREHAERIYPHECCGFLLGPDAWHVEAVVPATNSKGEEEAHNRFEITPIASLRAEKEARTRGLSVIGHYHSHPDSRAVPSTPDTVSASATGETGGSDLEHATWPNSAFVIVSVMNGKAAEVTCWNLKEDRSAFDAVTIEIEQRQESP